MRSRGIGWENPAKVPETGPDAQLGTRRALGGQHAALLALLEEIKLKAERPGKDRKRLKNDIANLEKNQTELLEIKKGS
jgi:hypothetical protein